MEKEFPCKSRSYNRIDPIYFLLVEREIIQFAKKHKEKHSLFILPFLWKLCCTNTHSIFCIYVVHNLLLLSSLFKVSPSSSYATKLHKALT